MTSSLITTIVTSYILRIKKSTRNGKVESFRCTGEHTRLECKFLKKGLDRYKDYDKNHKRKCFPPATG